MATSIGVASDDVRARFEALKAPLDPGDIEIRLDSARPKPENGRLYTRHVSYFELPTGVTRLDSQFLGEWAFTVVPMADAADDDGVVMKVARGTITILGLVREDVGMGSTPKAATTDAFKRCCRLWGIGLELWSLPPLWVEVDQYGKLLEDPRAVLARLLRGEKPVIPGAVAAAPAAAPATAAAAPAAPAPAQWPKSAVMWAPVRCSLCGSRMYDNRTNKLYPDSPDYKCSQYAQPPKGTGCKGKVQYADGGPKALQTASRTQVRQAVDEGLSEADDTGPDPRLADAEDDLPF